MSGGVRMTPLLRLAAMTTLTVQNAAQALMVKYSRTGRPPGRPPYLGSSVVLVCEIVKLAAAAALLQARAGQHAAARALAARGCMRGAQRQSRHAFSFPHSLPRAPQADSGRALAQLRAAPWRRSWLFAVPAAVYALQNNMLLVAVRRLDPPTFLVLSQAKIMTTAGFSVALLGRRLHRVRWCARCGARVAWLLAFCVAFAFCVLQF